MPHNVAFHQGLHCLLRQNQSSKKEIQYFWKLQPVTSQNSTMDHPDYLLHEFCVKFQRSKKG